MDNKKVTPQELNDEALEGATGGAGSQTGSWQVGTCSCGHQAVLHQNSPPTDYICPNCKSKISKWIPRYNVYSGIRGQE